MHAVLKTIIDARAIPKPTWHRCEITKYDALLHPQAMILTSSEEAECARSAINLKSNVFGSLPNLRKPTIVTAWRSLNPHREMRGLSASKKIGTQCCVLVPIRYVCPSQVLG
jgi:hypothetical protein